LIPAKIFGKNEKKKKKVSTLGALALIIKLRTSKAASAVLNAF
jgi:hypothetical protein